MAKQAAGPGHQAAAGPFLGPDDEEESGDNELPAPAPLPSASEPCLSLCKTSSPAFEAYRGSLRARHGPLFVRFAALLAGERGLSAGADLDLGRLGLAQLGSSVEALVQLADLRQETPAEDGQKVEELNRAALDLFEALCETVAALPHAAPWVAALPPEVYAEGLQRRWGAGSGDGELEIAAVRAAALFRLRDTVASLYAWALLSRFAAASLLASVMAAAHVVSPATQLSQEHEQRVEQQQPQQVQQPQRWPLLVMDPMAGTGLHGAIFQAIGAAEVMLADSFDGSGAPPMPGAAPAASFRGDTAPPATWSRVSRCSVFEASDAARAWWLRGASHGAGPAGAAASRAQPRGSSISVLLLSYPPPPPSTVGEAALRRFEGDHVIFIGEWRGCTGSASLFDALEKDWEVSQVVDLPRWPMMEDRAWSLRRRRDGTAGRKAASPSSPIKMGTSGHQRSLSEPDVTGHEKGHGSATRGAVSHCTVRTRFQLCRTARRAV